MTYPGQVKVTAIRETRRINIAIKAAKPRGIFIIMKTKSLIGACLIKGFLEC